MILILLILQENTNSDNQSYSENRLGNMNCKKRLAGEVMELCRPRARIL